MSTHTKNSKEDAKVEKIAQKTARNLELISSFVDHVKMNSDIEIPEELVVSFFEEN